jgi:hypothetical protein
MFDKEMTNKLFMKQVMTLLSDNLAMNITPQVIKPMLDVYANKDSFSGRPIESMSMERLIPEERFNNNTSMTARGTSKALNKVAGAFNGQSLSPVEIDHLLRGYFGWLGSFVVDVGDIIARPTTGQVDKPTPDYWKVATGGMVSDKNQASSRYVSQMYTQAKEIEQAYGTYRQLQKTGRPQDAANFVAENRDKLKKYETIGAAKKEFSLINERIRMIERSSMDSQKKRDQIQALKARENRIAEMVN